MNNMQYNLYYRNRLVIVDMPVGQIPRLVNYIVQNYSLDF